MLTQMSYVSLDAGGATKCSATFTSKQNPLCVISPAACYPAGPSRSYLTKMSLYSNLSPYHHFSSPRLDTKSGSHPPFLLAAFLCKEFGATSQSYSHWEAGGVTRATVNLRLPPTHTRSVGTWTSQSGGSRCRLGNGRGTYAARTTTQA
jgi:hypothetical protein